MSFYKSKLKPTGDMANELYNMAEDQYLNNELADEEIKAELGEEDYSQMAYKDDDGYWRVTGDPRKWDDYESMAKALRLD